MTRRKTGNLRSLLAAGVSAAALLAIGCSRPAAASPAAELSPVGRTVDVRTDRSTVAAAPVVSRPARESARALSPAEERWGIEVLGATASGAGYMLDLRYRVLDPAKAAPLLVRDVPTRLVDEATGAVHLVPSPPTVGPLRQTTRRPEAGRIYFELFANPGGTVRPGDRVTFVLGDFTLEHVAVR
jgi:hypothetical protein